VVVRPLLSSKRRPHFKTRKSVERTKIRSWVPTGPETKNVYAGEGQQQFTELGWLVDAYNAYSGRDVLTISNNNYNMF
jgi:hypothetical protein